MSTDNPVLDRLAFIALTITWTGIWGAWIQHRVVALTQNAVDLAEWATFLSDVRYGSLHLTPDLLRLTISLAVVALAIAARPGDKGWARWSVRVVALAPGFLLLPPYNFLLSPFGSGHEVRYAVALVMWVGVGLTLLIDRLPPEHRRRFIFVLCLFAVVGSVGTFSALLPPFKAHYNQALFPGWGIIAFVIGLLSAGGIQIWGSIQIRSQE